MSLSLRFLSKVVSTCVFALLTLLTYAATDCSVGYKPQTNPFSRWSGCGITDNGFGETSSTANGEWSAGFNFGDFIAVKGKAYCLNEQYSMPSQRTSCDEYAFPVVENVNTTQTGNVCWCQVTAWQPFTASRDAPFEEVEAKYIQMPVNAVESCTLQSCGNICASIGASNGRSIGLEHTSAGLRAAMYQSVKKCVPDESYTPETCAEWEHEQENPLASKWSNCGIIGDYSAGSYGADGENGDWYASFDISDFVHTIRGKAYCVEQIPNTPAETPDNKQGICGSYSFAISETIDTARTGNYCWCQVTEYKTDNNTDFKPVQSAYIGLPTAFTNPSCTPKLCAQACATVGDYSSGRRTNFDNLARRDNVGLRAAMYQSVKQCLPDDQLTCDEIGYTLQDNECTPITYTITYKDKDNNLITEFVETSVATTYTIESETITLPTPSAPEGMEFVGWYYNAQFNGETITQIATNSYGNKTLYAKWVSSSCEIGTKTKIQNGALTCTQECADGYTKQTNPFRREHEAVPSNGYYGITFNTITGNPNPYSNGTDFRYDSTLPKGHWRVRFDDFSFVVGGRGVCLADAGSRYGEYIDYKDESQTGSHCWCQLTEHIPRKIVNGNPVLDMDNASILSGKYVYYGDTKPSHSIYLLNSNTCEDWCPMACADETSRTNTLTTISDSWSFLSFRAVLWRYSLRLCKIEDYTITYKDGDEVVDTLNYRITDDIELPTLSPADDKHVFYGWCVDEPNCSVAQTVTGTKTGWYGNKTLYAKWGETETPIVTPESECEPGYYLPQNSDTCTICEENNYCTGGTNPIMQPCPTGLVSPTGTISADNCGKIMLVGEDVLYLTQKQQTTPALAVKLDNKTYYAKTTPLSQIEQQTDINTKYFLRTKIDNVEYAIHDNTVQRRN